VAVKLGVNDAAGSRGDFAGLGEWSFSARRMSRENWFRFSEKDMRHQTGDRQFAIGEYVT
jgi:hypothetical protein